MNALVVVDMQRDFVEGRLAVPQAAEIIPLINRLRDAFRLVALTRDWHPANHGSFAINHPGGKLYSVVDLNGLPQVLWPVHCVQGSPGAEFAHGLETRGAAVFPKGTNPGADSYSGFRDHGDGEKMHATGLGEWLDRMGVTHVFVCGVATDYCVKATALDAVRLGYRCTLLADACRAVNREPGDEERALEEMRRAGVELTTSGAVLQSAVIEFPVTGPAPPEAIRFAADAMLGRLARWLRMLGYDVAMDETLHGRRLVEAAVADRRWVLTRNRRFAAELPDDLLKLADIHVVAATALPDQIREVAERFSLATGGFRFTRCVVCNEPLEPVEPLSRDLILPIPPEVLARETHFWHCRLCGRFYWHGSHVRRSERKLDEWLGGIGAR